MKEVRQKSIHHISPLWNSRKCGGGGQEGKENIGVSEGLQMHLHKETFSGDGCDRYRDCRDCFMGIQRCRNSSNCILRHVLFTVCLLYLSKTEVLLKHICPGSGENNLLICQVKFCSA